MKIFCKFVGAASFSLVFLFAGISAYAGDGPCMGVGSPCVDVNITATTQEFATLTADPTSVMQGAQSLLTWSCTGTNSLGIPPFVLFSSGNFNMGSGTYDASTDSTTFGPSSGKVYVTPPAPGKTYTVTCYTSGGSNDTPGSASATVTVTGTGIDLTAGSISPTTATVNSSQTFSAVVTNSGSNTTGSGFTDLFQKASDASGTGAADIGTYASAALAGGGSNTASLSYTFNSVGTSYLRACADKSSAGNLGVIAESNENNNCGPWTAITVQDVCYGGGCTPNGTGGTPGGPGPGGSCQYPNITQPSGNPFQCCSTSPGACPATPGLPSALLTATPTSILKGSSSKLTWTSSNATSCTSGDFGTGGATSNSTGVSVSPQTTTTYGLTCVDGLGNSAYSSAQVAVTVADLSITAAPNPVRKGDSTTVSWNASGNLNSCTVTGPGLSSSALSGSGVVSISAESTYILSCIAGAFHPSASTVVKLIPSFKEF